jgi:hypothetical protein
MKLTTENLIRFGIALLLMVCLFDLPSGYYQLFRFVILIGFSILAYYEIERKNTLMVIVFIGLALLFQPLTKVPLDRQVWNIIDAMVAAGLVATVLLRKPKSD